MVSSLPLFLFLAHLLDDSFPIWFFLKATVDPTSTLQKKIKKIKKKQNQNKNQNQKTTFCLFLFCLSHSFFVVVGWFFFWESTAPIDSQNIQNNNFKILKPFFFFLQFHLSAIMIIIIIITKEIIIKNPSKARFSHFIYKYIYKQWEGERGAHRRHQWCIWNNKWEWSRHL